LPTVSGAVDGLAGGSYPDSIVFGKIIREGQFGDIEVFQPLIVGLFCLLLIFLFFVTALMDVRRTQNTLLDVFENKGVTIIETVETIAQNKLKGLMGITNRATVSFQDLESIEEGFRMQEAILNRLIEFARELDRREEGGGFTRKELATLALEALFNEEQPNTVPFAMRRDG